MSETQLPQLDKQRREHCQKVRSHIAAIIEREGPITFERFMSEALYAPGLGYYRSGQHKLGRQGDFITAPELSSLFSWTLANQCAEVLAQLDQGVILEIGAGSGALAVELLKALADQGWHPNYYILEVSNEMRHRQYHHFQQHIPEYSHRIHWLNAWPQSIEGVVIANEVLDAFPVHLLHYKNDSFQQYGVTWHNEAFNWHMLELEPKAWEHLLQPIKPLLTDDYTFEFNAALTPWITSLGELLKTGMALMIDYGFPRHELYHPQRAMGTLMCHIDQQTHGDPLCYPGIQDITSHVDFTLVAESAYQTGLEVAGFCPQMDFLMNCGITDMLDNVNDTESYFKLAQQVKMLTMPSEMGELFKVMALTQGIDGDWLGFRHNDQRHRLGSIDVKL